MNVPTPDEMSVDAGVIIARLQARVGELTTELYVAQAVAENLRKRAGMQEQPQPEPAPE